MTPERLGEVLVRLGLSLVKIQNNRLNEGRSAYALLLRELEAEEALHHMQRRARLSGGSWHWLPARSDQDRLGALTREVPQLLGRDTDALWRALELAWQESGR